MACRKCAECRELDHHWVDNSDFGDEDEENNACDMICKHCEALGDACDNCSGTGDDWGEPCAECDGNGVCLKVDGKTDESEKPKAGIKVLSVFGQSRIEITDGVNAIAVDLTRNGVESLLQELQTVLDMAD